MIVFVICSGVITVFAILLCVFSGQQQRKEDAYLTRQGRNQSAQARQRARQERADWDLLNNWNDGDDPAPQGRQAGKMKESQRE